jgi:hypothetical protein
VQIKQLASKRGLRLADGRERHGPLPGVTSDAVPHKNRELAERISDVVESLKVTDEHGPHFVLAWRMYPNKDHPRWQTEDPHACGCSCGNVAPLRGRKKKKTAKKSTSKTTAKKKSKTTAKKSKSRKKTR